MKTQKNFGVLIKISKDMKAGETINLTEWINTKDDGRIIHKLVERKPKQA